MNTSKKFLYLLSLVLGTIGLLSATVIFISSSIRGADASRRILDICESYSGADPRKGRCIQQAREVMDNANTSGFDNAFIPFIIGAGCTIFALASSRNTTKVTQTSLPVQTKDSPTTSDLIDKLRDLAAMRDKGLIDEEEFQRLKTKLISQT